MILILKHISIEGPGTILDFIGGGENSKIIELDQNQSLPKDLTDIDAVITLGGPMNVYEEDKYPFLIAENQFLKEVIKKQIPLLGICLGSQLIAKACEAMVSKSTKKEIGWSTVVLTDEGLEDPLFKGVNERIKVFQWHEDTFEVPEGGEFLATSTDCSNQAFRVGKCVYGLQFHIEVTDEIIESWVKKYFKVEKAKDHPEGKKMMEQYGKLKVPFNNQAEKICKNFATIIAKNKKQLNSL